MVYRKRDAISFIRNCVSNLQCYFQFSHPVRYKEASYLAARLSPKNQSCQDLAQPGDFDSDH